MGSNKTMTPEEIKLQMEDFLSSGLTMQDYADSHGLNYSTFKSRVQKWKKEHGIPLERQGFIRSNNPKPIQRIETPKEETKILNDEVKDTNKMNETIIPASKKEDQKNKIGRPLKNINETKFSFGMNQEEFDLLKAYCTIKGKTIKDTISEAIKEYLSKPENQGTIQEAEKLLKIIKRNK